MPTLNNMSMLDWIELMTSDRLDTDTREQLGKLKRRADMLLRNFGYQDQAFIEAEAELAAFVERMNLAGGYDALA